MNFILSTDSCADLSKRYLMENHIYCIPMKRLVKGKCIDSFVEESESFYETLEQGELPETVPLGKDELQTYFESILKTEGKGDLVHIALSGGLSETCANAQAAALALNENLKGRKIVVVDSLIASPGMVMLMERLVILQKANKETDDAVKQITQMRDRLQAWVIASDLFYLKRGGRISRIKATIGTMLNIKPIIVVTRRGKLALENKIMGNKHAVDYVMGKMKELGEDANENFLKGKVYVFCTSETKLFDELKEAVKEKYPALKIQEGMVGPIIGTHLGCGVSIVCFEGAKRLNIYEK